MLLEHPNDYKLQKGQTELFKFWFIADCPSFGFWTSLIEANYARDIWLKQYRSASQSDWKRYCESRGFKQVMFR
jgi:hypothetical protein